MALIELAKMNAALGDTQHADEWQSKAEALKAQTNALLWQLDKGFYLTHAHISSLEHPFDESNMVSIANALAVSSGLTDFQQSQLIFQNLEKATVKAGVKKPGLSIYPFYPNQWPNLFFDYLGMGYGNYQNGGVWDWWGGVQIKTEFINGFAEEGQRHLLQVANDWQKHPGNIIEWQSSTDPRHEGSHYYSAAAGTMGSAIIEGFFGVELDGNGLTLQPRLGLNDGFIRVYQAATDRYAAYSYDWDQNITRLDYGTNAVDPVKIKVLKLRSEHIRGVTIDGRPVEFDTETVGKDTYTVVSVPSGQHSLEIIKGQPLVQPAAVEIEAASTPSAAVMLAPDPTRPSIAPNLDSPPQTTDSEDSSPAGVSLETAVNSPDEAAALSTGEIPASAPIEANNPLVSENIRQTRNAFFRFVGASLAILIGLLLMVLVALRRTMGLN
jgi:hypothetical protein